MDNSLEKGVTSSLITEPSLSIYNIHDKFSITEDSIKDFEKFVPIEDENTESQFSFGVIEEDGEKEGVDLEKYYNGVIQENPENPLVLRDYAQYLESKGDLTGAEKYYYRATVADPKNGDILCRYAKLVWKLHHDFNKASSYFQSAAKAAPGNCYVLAAYASFLWETDVNNEDNSLLSNTQGVNAEEENRTFNPGNSNNATSIDASSNESYTSEEYYKRMLEENPTNIAVLKNYARFLHQSKGDLNLAEDYYSRAIQVDPLDGDILSQYANLVWQLHRDKEKAASYFELAVQAAPKDSDVLASYAKFLWEFEE